MLVSYLDMKTIQVVRFLTWSSILMIILFNMHTIKFLCTRIFFSKHSEGRVPFRIIASI